MECAAGTGEEFNPLKEVNKYGIQNPYQDPGRGTIEDLVADGDSRIAVEPTYVLQQLEGKDSIIGRSIVLTSTEDPTSVYCCTIAIDETPAGFAPKPIYPSQKYPDYSQYAHIGKQAYDD